MKNHILDNLFFASVTDAVELSISSKKPLVVYSTSAPDNNTWIHTWFNEDSALRFKEYAIWLKLIQGTDQFNYFKQIFSSVTVPSVFVVKNGQLSHSLTGEQNISNHWEALSSVLEFPILHDSANIDAKHVQKIPIKSEKEELENITQKIEKEEMVKQQRLAQEEKERILSLVASDREERKKRNSAEIGVKEIGNKEVFDNIKDTSILHTKTCTLLIKLTNSTSLRNTFDSKTTLNEVRKWVDMHRTDGDVPYSFHRNIPRLTFLESDELKTLETLSLTPRSVLILKPLENFYSKINVTDIQSSGILGGAMRGLSNWWKGNDVERNNDLDESKME